MITLGYITKLNDADNNLFEVRIPIFEKAGSTASLPGLSGSYFNANLGYNPGNLNSYKVGDCVVVGFLDNKYATPVILGKLFTGEESKEEPSNYNYSNALKITGSAQLPENTQIGDLSYKQLLTIHRNLENVNDLIKDIQEGGGGGGTPTVKSLNTTATVSLSPSSSESIAGTGKINLHKISKTGAFGDLVGAPTVYTPSSHVHGEISNDGKIGATPITTGIDCAVVTDNNSKLQRVTMQSLASKLSVPSISASTTTVSGANDLGSIVINGSTYNVPSGGSGGVPYSGATDNVNLGNHSLTAKTVYSTDAVANTVTFDDGNYWKDVEVDSNHKLHLKNYNDNEQLTGDLTFPNDITGTVATSDLLKPTLVGQTLIADGEGSSITSANNYAEFTIDASDMNGIYVFTYGNCMIPIVAYGLQSGIEYKTSAALVDADGNYKVKVLTYKYASALNKIWFYNKEDYMPIGWGAALYKIKLY